MLGPGLEQLKAQHAGRALRSLEDARDLLGATQAASKAYDRAEPVTSAVEHEYADLELKDAIEKPYARVRDPGIWHTSASVNLPSTPAMHIMCTTHV